MSKTLYCQFMLSICHAEIRRSVFKICCKSREKFTQFVLAYFQLLYTVVTRLDFRKFIGCKVVPLPPCQKDEAEGVTNMWAHVWGYGSVTKHSLPILGISECPIPGPWYCILEFPVDSGEVYIC